MSEQFEKWFHEVSFGMEDGYKSGLKVILFTAWAASRATVEIELPARKSAFASGYGDGYLVEQQGGEAIDHDETVEILRAAGLRVKEK